MQCQCYVFYAFVQVNHPEEGDPSLPDLVLLHGFPTD